jgi:hypothetical protein
MPPPTDIKTRTASVRLSQDGFVLVTILAEVTQSLADANDNISAAEAAAAGRRRPILVDIRKATPLSPETRRLYSGKRLTEAFTALALLVEPNPVGRLLGNVYFRIAKPEIPIKLFDQEAAAVAWLKERL